MIDLKKIKELGAIYRVLEKVKSRHHLAGLDNLKSFYGNQLLSAAHLNQRPLNHIIEIENQTRKFPRPKFAIGQVVQFFRYQNEDDELAIVVITGMKYRQTSYELPIGWWYDVGELGEQDSFHSFHETDLKACPAQKKQTSEPLSDESQTLLETFLDNFECSHGPLFPYEEVK